MNHRRSLLVLAICLGSRNVRRKKYWSAMKNLKTRLAVLLLSTLGLLTGALLAQQSPPSADTFVSSGAPKANFGSSIILVVGSGTTTYMKFNLSGVPSGATVNKATLRLFLDAVSTGGQFDVYNLPAAPTWSERTLTYNTPPPALGLSATGGHPIAVSTSSVNTFLLIDITPTVQNWLTNPSSNNGVALALIGTAGYFSFESKEGVFTSHEPELEIVLNSTSNTVTSVGSGLGLTGGPITTTGTLNIDPTVVPQLGAASNMFTGNITALSFSGNGAGLTNVNAAKLNGVAGYNVPSLSASNNFLGNQTITGNLNIAGIGSTLTVGGPSVFNMDVTPGPAVTSNCLASAGAACTGFQFNGLPGNNIFNAQINGTTELNVDASGNMTLNGLLNLPVTSATSGIATTGVLTLGGANFAHAYGANGLNSQNTFFGTNAGNFTMTGELNVAIGSAALASNTSGQGNTAMGSPPPHSSNPGNRGALGSNTTGSGNTAMGSPHSDPNTHKSNNSSSLSSNTTGSDNTSLGASSLGSNTTGNNNVALGSLAGLTLTAANANTTGSSNTFVGYESGPGVSTEIDNATALGANASVNCSNCMVLGDSTLPMLVGIGTNAPLATLDVEAPTGPPPTVIFGSANPVTFTVNGTTNIAGSLTVNGQQVTGGGGIGSVVGTSPISASTSGGTATVSLSTCPSGQVLASTGPGWACSTVSGAGGGITGSGMVGSLPLFATLNSVASSNVFQGLTGNIGIGTATPQATLDVNGIINLPNTTSSYMGMLSLGGLPFISNFPGTVSAANTFLGTSAGNQIMAGSAIQNTAVGNSALTANTIGYDNSAFGFQALNANTLGNNNSAFGPSTLALNTLGNVNSAFGYGALGANKTGNANAAFGSSALAANESGSNNTAVGGVALGQLGSSTGAGGSSNIAIGFLAGYLLTGDESNNIDIGSQGVLGDSGIIRIGTAQSAAYIAGTLNVSNLTVGTCTGCGGGGSGGITSVTGTNGVNASTSGGAVTLSLNTAATNTFTGTQTFNVNTGNGIIAQTSSPTGAAVVGINAGGLAGSFQGNVAVTGNTSITGNLNVTGTVTCGSGCSGAQGPGGPGLRETRAALLQWYNKTYTVGSGPVGVAFDGSNIWVANQGSNTVTKLVASTGTVVGTYSVGSNPFGVAFDGTNIWVTNEGSNTVTALLASTGATVGTYTVGKFPRGVAFDGTNIWVTNISDNTVTKLLASTGATVGTYTVGGAPDALAFDGINIWVANQGSNTVTKLVASTGATVGAYSAGAAFAPYALAFDGTNIWVAGAGGNSVTELSASNGALVGTYTVGSFPESLAFDGTNIWVANSGSSTVTKLLASTGAVLGTYTLTSSPGGVAFDGTNIWVTNGGSVTRILGN
jgi:YVTN family beta-propeller protein